MRIPSFLKVFSGMVVLACSVSLPVSTVLAAPMITTNPGTVLQGEPFIITVSGTSSIKSLKFNGEKVPTFIYLGKTRGLVGVDLKEKPGEYTILVEFANPVRECPNKNKGINTPCEFSNGANKKSATSSIQVSLREHVEKPLGIPEKLGGNTTSSATQLVTSLAAENAILTKTRTYPKSLWTKAFRFPIANPIVTDGYGYTRQTGTQDITHKGTDFHAPVGTPVLAMNRGIVRLARTFRVYGKTIIIDHGQGLQTMYMHLSKINVNEGQLVARGQIIGKSGQTGYAESPHLHLSVRIQGVSIDPMKFMELFK